MTIVFQSFSTQKKTSHHLRLLVWTCPLTLSSLSSILSPLPRKYLLIQRRLTRRLLHLYKLLTILQLQSKRCFFTPTGLQFSISLPKTDQSKTTEKLPPFHSLLPDVRPLLSRPIKLKLQPDHSTVGRQHRRETILIAQGEQNDPASINIYYTVSNKNSPYGN